MTTKKPRIESDQLNTIFVKWAENQGISGTNPWIDHIDRINLKWGRGKQFNEYIWACGGRIGQEHRKRFAEFFNDEDLIMFTLRHL